MRIRTGVYVMPAATTAAVTAMTCQECGVVQVVPPPRDDVRIVRFCLARYPMRLCMHCCPCDRCRMRAITDWARGSEGYHQWVAEVRANNELLFNQILYDQWLAELRAIFQMPDP